MVKLAIDKLSRKIPKIEPKSENIINGINKNKKVRKSGRGRSKPNLERSPEADTFVQPANTQKIEKSDNKNRVGNFLVEKNRKLAKAYIKDLESVAQEIPEATFIREFNTGSTKELPSILDKLTNRSEQYAQRGYPGVIRDGVRGLIFLPNADKNYTKVVDAMKRKGYKIAQNFAEDANGNIILGKDGKPKMIEDIDIRFGKNAVPSGYEDVQLRFEKNGKLYELLFLPGPNYAAFYKKEHAMIFEQFRKYDAQGITKDEGAKQIVKAIKKEFHGLTKKLYADALNRDTVGSIRATSPITFESQNIDELNALFKSLKNLFRGKFEALPPSKRSGKEFKQTKNWQILDTLEQKLRKVMDLYKPIEK